MVTQNERLGLLSKMAKFVRNPTKDWSDLDKPEPDEVSGYDRQALKSMIERKRQNDFVRKREFDQLRKLRDRAATGSGKVAPPSVFQNSVVTDHDGRVITLKKIDEIEALMSKQWWRGKQELSTQASPLLTKAPSTLRASTGNFETTQGIDYLETKALTEFTETAMGEGMDAIQTPATASQPSHAGFSDTNGAFSASKLFAADTNHLVTDPELEEAAIRFANGDDAGAETALLEALRSDSARPEVQLALLGAVLDLYRAIGRRHKFDQTILEFSAQLGGVAPTWECAPLPLFEAEAIWVSPAELTADAMELLRDAMGAHPMPWQLDWSDLERITPPALPLVEGLFASLCNEPVALRFSGCETLVKTLRVMMPSGDRTIPSQSWTVLFSVLRATQMIDEFELAALDYCLTYELAPPAWEPARCEFERVDAAASLMAGALTLELTGDVLGDATRALTVPDAPAQRGERIVVNCSNLVRVDFSAAGSILNWVATRQADGYVVEFREVHRLAAAFFGVIGINEYARVITKSI